MATSYSTDAGTIRSSYTAFQTRLLLVEADPWAANRLQLALRHRNFVVSIARDCSDARTLAASGSYQVIVIDLSSPELPGVALCRQLRRDGITTKVLIIDEHGKVGDLIEGFDAGADAYLLGPTVWTELFTRIGALVRQERWAKDLDSRPRS